MKTYKRVISIILSALMMLSVSAGLDLTVFAADPMRAKTQSP